MPIEQLSFLSDEENKAWAEVRGRILPVAAEQLYRFALQADPKGVSVEIGSFSGKSTICLARGLRDAKREKPHLFAIDVLFQSDFHSNLARFGVAEIVESLETTSLEAAEKWKEPISFLYVDGHHGKAHAYADLLVWDQMIVPGGVVAADDTGGFMLGPSLQLQAALRSGAYELLTEAGGMSFLRKRRSILPSISDFPVSEGSIVAYLHYVSAWLGAMNTDFRTPARPKRLPSAESDGGRLEKITNRLKRIVPWRSQVPRERVRRTEAKGYAANLEESQRILEWLGSQAPREPGLAGTLDYLNACLDLRHSRIFAAIEKLKGLSKSDASLHFVHYHILIRDMATLRLAQAYDLEGSRVPATETYSKLLRDTEVTELRQEAKQGLAQPFVIPAPDENLLLREYALQLAAYRRLQ